ncbi:MAG TPA: hypothetical protein VFV02_02215 [Acidimicrobiales bacterium]|nr:hypothetical protein [Acidimicrobiales bacterium]
MPWLLREGDVLAAIEDRRKGWQTSISGAVVITRPAFIQTLTRAAASELDIAWCIRAALGEDRAGYQVKRISILPGHRLAWPHLRPGALVAAPAGTFERWRLQVGDRLEVRGS